MLATIDRSIPPPGGWQPIYNTIPPSLYLKAWLQQHQLTEEKRCPLFSRGDLVGKALAYYPDSLTPAETY